MQHFRKIAINSLSYLACNFTQVRLQTKKQLLPQVSTAELELFA